MQHRLREEFAQVMSAQTFKADNLAAGRAYIKAYVEFLPPGSPLNTNAPASSVRTGPR